MIGGEHMKTRRLGKTGLMVSEIGFGGEWLERHTETEGIELIRYASEKPRTNIKTNLMLHNCLSLQIPANYRNRQQTNNV